MANPKLRKDDTGTILEGLKKIEANGSVEKLKGKDQDLLPPDDLDRWSQDAGAVIKLMNAYQPKTEDAAPHEEMSAVLAQFVKLATDHQIALNRVRDENRETAALKASLKQEQAKVEGEPTLAGSGVSQEK
jgi:hypothetical protein